MAGMTTQEKIAQFFVLRGIPQASAISPSGFLLPAKTLYIDTNFSVLKHSRIPFFVGLDLISVDKPSDLIELPNAFQLSALTNAEQVYEYGNVLGGWLTSMGFNFVIGPSLDIDQIETSPFTLESSFGSDAESIIETGSAFMQGLRVSGVLSIAGNFPGVGNTNRGFESGPPIVYTKRSDFYRKDLTPFKALINQGAQAVLMANAYVPGLDSSGTKMASTSFEINRILKDELGFYGLIWSDFSSINPTPETITGALLSGVEIMIINDDILTHISEVERLIDSGRISMEDIDQRCKKILQSKLWLARQSMSSSKQVSESFYRKLHLKNREIYSESIILVKNKNQTIPLTHLDTTKLAVVHFGSNQQMESVKELTERYTKASYFHIRPEHRADDFSRVMSNSSDFNKVIIIAEQENTSIARFGLSENTSTLIKKLSETRPSIFVWKGHPKALRFIETLPGLKAIIVAHKHTEWSNDLILQSIFGGREINGKLKRNLSESFQAGTQHKTAKIRLAYGLPEEVGINPKSLEKIATIARNGIKEMAYPGCQVWFAKDGIVVVNESFGHHTYQSDDTVKQGDLYDLASITKIAASAAGLMKLTQLGQFSLDYRLCDYLPEWVDTTAYMQITMREILAHQAGLKPFVPFYAKTMSKGVPRYDVYSLAKSDVYPTRVAREFYIRKDYKDLIFRQIINEKLGEKKYLYSDLGYYFMQRIIEKQSGVGMDRFLDSTIYAPLGLATLGYSPLDRFSKERITPTEFDRVFRNQLIHGDVHDPGAAMMGGVAGHAGLFSNANDLGILMQMFLNGGHYGGADFFTQEIISDFTKCQFCDADNRRGAAFDKPLRDGSPGPSCGCTDLEAFGHQGFTGTVTWADPGENVVYVFLSNRVYPNAGNKKLSEMNIRTDIQKVFYDAIKTEPAMATP